MFEHSFRTTKKTQSVVVTRISWLMLFKEIIAVYSESHVKSINTFRGRNAELLIVKADSKYSYHKVLKV
jgi:hypothetical protein